MPRETKSEDASCVERGVRLLTVQQAARYLSVSVSTLYGWVWQRRIPFVKVGRGLRFDLSDLEGFIEANRIRPGGSGFSAR